MRAMEKCNNMTHSIESLQNLIRKLSWQYSRTTSIPVEDLVSEATVALLSALDTYDPAKGAKTTFAYRVISNRLISVTKEWQEMVTIDSEEEMEYTLYSFPCHRPSGERELEFRQLLLSMSREAQEVVSILFNSPIELMELAKSDMPKSIRGALKEALRNRGWSWPKIWRTFKEIKTVLT